MRILSLANVSKQNSVNNKNLKNNYVNSYNLTSNPTDSLSFGAVRAEKVNPRAKKLVQDALKNYNGNFESDVKRFNFLATEFLKENGVSIKHKNIDQYEIPIKRETYLSGIVKNVAMAEFVNQNGISIHRANIGANKSVIGVTKKDAELRLIEHLVSGGSQIKSEVLHSSSLGNVPPELIVLTAKISNVSKRLQSMWMDVIPPDATPSFPKGILPKGRKALNQYDADKFPVNNKPSKKAKILQEALELLLPSK